MESHINGVKINCEQECADKYFGGNGNLTIVTDDQPKTVMENGMNAADVPNSLPPKIMIFEPSLEEFKDFDKYIKYMEDQGAHRAGIAKIKPPPEYQPTDEIKLKGLRIDGAIKHLRVTDQNGNLIVSTESFKGFAKGGIKQGDSEGKITVEEFERLSKSDPHKPPQVPEECLEPLFWYLLDHGLNPLLAANHHPGTLMRENAGAIGWDLNNLSSVLTALEKHHPDVCKSTLSFGTWGSFFAWHTKNYELYSVNYLHKGCAQWWYSIPPSYARKFESFAKEKSPKEMQTCSAFLRHKRVLYTKVMLSAHGIPFDKVIQNQGELVITFPNCYHSGFSTGFSITESAHFGSRRWIDYAKYSSVCPCPGSKFLWLRSVIKKFQPEHYENWKKGEDVGYHPEFRNEKMCANPPTKEEMDFDEKYFEDETKDDDYDNEQHNNGRDSASGETNIRDEDTAASPQILRVLRSSTKRVVYGKRIHPEDGFVTPKKGQNQGLVATITTNKKRKISSKNSVVPSISGVGLVPTTSRRIDFEALDSSETSEQQMSAELESSEQQGSLEDDGRRMDQDDAPQPSSSKTCFSEVTSLDPTNNYESQEKGISERQNDEENNITDYKAELEKCKKATNLLLEELEDRKKIMIINDGKRARLEDIIILLKEEISLKDRSIKRFQDILSLDKKRITLVSISSNSSSVPSSPARSSIDSKLLNSANDSPENHEPQSATSASTKKPFPCTECDKSYSSKSALKNHVISKHSDETFMCIKCGTKCSNKYTLLRHHQSYCPSRSHLFE